MHIVRRYYIDVKTSHMGSFVARLATAILLELYHQDNVMSVTGIVTRVFCSYHEFAFLRVITGLGSYDSNSHCKKIKIRAVFDDTCACITCLRPRAYE